MIRRFLVIAFVLVVALSQSACIGQMALAGRVGAFNLEVVEGKWQREAVFLLLYIIPVYPIAGAIDLLIVNSIEFHTGTNPLTDKPRIAAAQERTSVAAADGSRATSIRRADGSIDIEVITSDGSRHTVNLTTEGHGAEERLVARSAEGARLGDVSRSGVVTLATAER